MKNPRHLRSFALIVMPLAASAAPWTAQEQAAWKDGQFEVSALYGKAPKLGDGLDFYGASVAGGYYFGNHLLQLECGALLSESAGNGTISGVNPANPAQSFTMRITDMEIQRIPVWLNYRYGRNFGADGRFRLEAGPVLGASVETLRSEYDLTVTEGTTVSRYRDRSEQSGGLAFEYGVAAAARARLGDHWSLVAGYRWVRSTEVEFRHHTKELDTSTLWVYQNARIEAHSTHYVSLGAEYRF